MIMQCLSCVKKDEFKWIDHKEFDLNKYTTNNSKEYALGVDLEYPKELCELHNNFSLATDKLEIKEEMFPNIEYWLLIFTIFPLVMLKPQCLNFLIKKSVCFVMKNVLEAIIKTKINTKYIT